MAASDPLPRDGLEAEAEWETAVGLIAPLTAAQQDVLMLRFLGDMSLLAVAETLGKSLGAVKTLQHRALAAISRLVADEEVRVDEHTDPGRPQARSSTTSPS